MCLEPSKLPSRSAGQEEPELLRELNEERRSGYRNRDEQELARELEEERISNDREQQELRDLEEERRPRLKI